MNEYIEWDKKNKRFCFPKCGCGITINEWFEFYEKSENFSIHQCIKMRDVNNQPIYEKCSIVSIGYSWQEPEEQVKGFFKYDHRELAYLIYDIEKKEYVRFDISKMQYIEVVDTVQENKLGLI